MIIKDTTSPDIIQRLWDRARAGSEDAALLGEAALIIETLRVLIDIRQEIEFEDAEPEGRA